MNHEASAHNLLECILLDENKDPTNFPIWLLEYITSGFSDDQKIGSGGFADVYKEQLQNGMVAVKKLKELPGMVGVHETKFVQEVDSLMKVKHKNIVRFLGYCSDTQGKLWKHEGKHVMADERQRFLCFEFMPQGSLDKHISDASTGLEWMTRYHIIKGICEGLQYLHGKKIVHADLKPENILLDHNMVPKIGDFGLARTFREEQTRAITQNALGTFGYMAPESFRGVITFKSDIYSLGIIITEMLTGQKKDDLSIENVHENWTARFKTSHEGTWLEHVRVCAEIGLDCMNFDPNKRPTIEDIMDRLAELERKYGFTEINLPATPVLDVYPLDIWFPLKPDKTIECPVTLTNNTDDLIGVWITPSSLQGCTCSSPGCPFDPGFPYVWEQSNKYVKVDRKSSLSTRLDPHFSETIYMTMWKKEQQSPLQAADKACMFDVVMIGTKSWEDLDLLDRHYRDHGTWREENKSGEDPFRRAKELGTVVHIATLRAAVTSDPAKCQEAGEVAVHQIILEKLNEDRRIYCIDVHPTKTWLLVGYSSGHVSIWNYETQETAIKLYEVKYLKELKYPGCISSIKFIDGEQWFAAGDEIGGVHVYAYTNTGICAEMADKVMEFEAHVRCAGTHLAVYPKRTLLLTASRAGDNSIKLWDWSQGWTCVRVIPTDGSVQYLKAGPRDTWATSTVASHSGYQKVEVWHFRSQHAIAAFQGSSLAFYAAGHRDILATLSYDTHTPSNSSAKIRDFRAKKHLHTLCPSMWLDWELQNLAGHPTLPILAGIITHHGSNGEPTHPKVNRIVFWDARTYRVMKKVDLLTEDDCPKMLFGGTEDITS